MLVLSIAVLPSRDLVSQLTILTNRKLYQVSRNVSLNLKSLVAMMKQNTLKRVDFAFNRFFKLKSGYPRFKASRRYKGWTYPCKSGWKALSNGKNGQLKISNLGII